MTDEELGAIRARVDAATPGPWAVEHRGSGHKRHAIFRERASRYYNGGRPISERLAWTETPYRESEAAADAEFIAHAREDIPALLVEIDRLRAAVQQSTGKAAVTCIAPWKCNSLLRYGCQHQPPCPHRPAADPR